MSSNLSQAFGTAAASTLAGRLPKVTPPQQPAPVAEPPAPPVAPPVAAPVVAPQAPPTAPPQADAESGTRQITVYVAPHVPAAIRSDKRGRSNAAVVYDAIEGHQAQLVTLVAARQAAPVDVVAGAPGGLFVRSAADVRTTAPQRVPWTFKTTPANRRTLDQLAGRYGARSRSELVSVALEAAYPAAAQKK